MAEMGVDLTKAVIGGAISKVMSAIAEEAELMERVESDIEFMKAEFEMMQSFLSVADEERVKNSVVRTWVRQVRDLAYDVEDYFEVFVHLDLEKSTWWWRIVSLPSCIARPLTLDEAVAGIKRLRARVEDVSGRNLRYRLISDSGSSAISADQAAGATYVILRGAEEAAWKQRDVRDLTELITSSHGSDLPVPQPQVISVCAAAGDLSLKTTSIIRKAFADKATCEAFPSRAWVKPMHPFNPDEFLRSLLTQFHANSLPRQFGAGVSLGTRLRMKKSAADTEDNLIEEFMQQVNRQRYLIVIEDLATLVEWDAIKMYLPDGENRSRIIVSTRHLGIAGLLCTGESYTVSGLRETPDDDSVCVFFNEGSGRPLPFDDMTAGASEFIKTFKLVGRQREMHQLYRILHSTDGLNDYVASVWGIAGVGKSFLVRTLYYNEILREPHPIFSQFTWVDVPHPFSLAEFSRCLHWYSPSQAERKSGRLIVIDGLRSTEEWDLIKTSLSMYTPYTVIAITDDENVGRHCANVEQSVLNIKCLEAGAALDLFAKEMKDPDRPYAPIVIEHLKNVNKCGGLPRVIVDVGRQTAWDNPDCLLGDGFMCELETKPAYASSRGLFAWMKFFFRTCPDYLKAYVYYMSVFPLGCDIRQNRLVRRWIAEGYPKDTCAGSAKEELDKVFSKLVDLSIIQRSSKDRVGTVNGFFHKYMVSQPMQDNLVCVLDDRRSSTNQPRERHLSVQYDAETSRKKKTIDMETIDFSLLRSLSVFSNWESCLVPCKMLLLQVLDLENATAVRDDDLSSIKWKWLPRLKFLSLRGCKDVSCLPSSLFGLEHLETLDVKGTSITKLPRGINKLQKLQYLRAGRAIPLEYGDGISTEGSYNAGVAVPLGIGKLTDLHTIGVVNVGAAGGKAVLKNLQGVRKLGVSGINPGNMRLLSLPNSHLRSLSVQFEGDNEDYSGLLHDILPDKLDSLKLYGPMCKFPAECIKKFCNLRKLTLQMRMLALDDLEVISGLGDLSVLHLFFNQFQGERRDQLSFKSMELKVLELACKSPLHVMFKEGTLRLLEVLKVHCFTGTKISGLENLFSISEVCLMGSCDETLEKELRRQIDNHRGKPAPFWRVERGSTSS